MQLFEWSLLFCCCVLAWFTFQVASFLDCARNVFETVDKSWEDYQQRSQPANFGNLSTNLALARDETETLVFWGLVQNFETINLSLELMEQWLITREILYAAQCTHWIVMKLDSITSSPYIDHSFMLIRVAEQIQGLRKEIGYVRFLKDGYVLYENDLSRLKATFENVMKKFHKLKRTTEQLLVTEGTFQPTRNKIPFEILVLLVPRYLPTFVPQIANAVKLCDQNLKKHPVYTMQWLEEEYIQQQRQRNSLQQEK